MDKVFAPEVINQLIEKSVDFHCHGVGRFDFTDIPALNLHEIENILAARKQQCILTMYLPKYNFQNFLELMDFFHEGKQLGKFRHIAGIGLEGPLLASHGGTPETGVWMPSKHHWLELARCGQKGLVYVILSPDAHLPGSNFAPYDTESPGLIQITETLLEGGVLPAPGHFTKVDPVASAKALQTMFDMVALWGQGSTITDHLYNDMPHNFKHAWRTKEEKLKRDQEIGMLNIDSWSLDSLEQNLGIVPATIIKNARKGLVKVCQNFDGEHVDLAVVKKTVELLGAENMLMMSDSIESKRLAGRVLHMQEGSTLLYQDEGIVAAGSQNIDRQIKNMLSIGLKLNQIEMITSLVPRQVLKKQNQYIEQYSYAEADSV